MSPKVIRGRRGDHGQLRAAGGQVQEGLREGLLVLLGVSSFLSPPDKEVRDEKRKERTVLLQSKSTHSREGGLPEPWRTGSSWWSYFKLF